MTRLDDETLRYTADTWKRFGLNKTLTAGALGIARSTLQERLDKAAKVGILSTLYGDAGGQTPPGFEVKSTTTLYGADGISKLQWVREAQSIKEKETLEAIKEAFDEYKGLAVIPTSDDLYFNDLATVYPIADLHLGMYSWKEETGDDYDLDIAKRILSETMAQLVGSTPDSKEAVILNLGDFFHSDSNENRTRRSGNALDVDTRYAKVLRTGTELMIHVIQLALTKHDRVLVRNLQGNHDPYAALALTVALDAYYHGSERVVVDTSPSPYFFWHFGRVLLGATHGDMAKPGDMPGIMAAMVPELWGQSDFRYVYTGHLHSKRKSLVSETSGAVIEVFQTLAPRDAWGNSMGFTAGRTMSAITMHKEKGEIDRQTVPVRKE